MGARRASKPKAPKRAVKATKKPRKPKRVTKKMQTGSLRKVWNGTKNFTKSGLTKKDLCLNANGKVMSKKAYKWGQQVKKSPWNAAVMEARKTLGITGFCAINRGAQGVALYTKAKELYKN